MAAKKQIKAKEIPKTAAKKPQGSGKISISKLRAKFDRKLLWQKIKWPTFIVGGILVFLLILLAGYSIAYSKKTYRNVYVGETDLGGKNKTEITDILKPKTEQFLTSEITLKYQPEEGESKIYKMTTSDLGLSYDLNKTADAVYGVGRQSGPILDFYQQLKTFFVRYQVNAEYSLNEEALAKKIADIAAEVDQPEKDYSLVYAGDGVFSLSSERQEGKRIDQTDIILNLKNNIARLDSAEVQFESKIFKPQITEENANKTLKEANGILAVGELNLTYSDKNLTLDVDTIAGLISSRAKKKELEIFIDSDRMSKQVEGIASNIDKVAGNAVLSLKDGKVVVSTGSQNGAQLDREQTKIDIENAILSRLNPNSTKVDGKNVKLKVAVLQPDIDSTKLATYGLNELVATGTTNFYNSPSNRIHNITIGANAISGTLLKPGEEFSTLGKLGKIDASTGYLPELVIKNNKTVPDYGGGLCQVSTTLFRAALNAGMKITQRQNHSYRVSYYEPPVGMDATIFDPAPDFKFVNNYSNYIFIQAKIVGTKITFEFYGTKDSRSVSVSTPEVYDYVEPPTAIETVDNSLAVGERKLVSHSHQGASAKFHYKVDRDGTILQETDFLSKYVALPEMWLVGPTDPNATAPAT